MNIAFLGLGHMGSGIAGNILKAGHRLIVWNRTAEKTRPFAEKGAAVAASPKAAAQEADIVITMLADDAAVLGVTDGPDGILAGLKPGGLHVSMSTIGVDTAERLTALHAERGQRFVSAPVLGRPDAAEAAKLFVVTAGPAKDLDEAQPIFDAVGQKSFRVGDRPAHANLVKLCGNFMILSTIESMAEAMTVAQKGGVAKATLLEVLTGSLFPAPVHQNYGKILVEERFRPAGFAAPLGLKDMRLLAATAEASRAPMPVLNVVRVQLIAALAQEGEDIDWSGIARAVERSAGLS